MIAGILEDATGNYRTGFTVLALLAGLGSLFLVLARRPERPLAAQLSGARVRNCKLSLFLEKGERARLDALARRGAGGRGRVVE